MKRFDVIVDGQFVGRVVTKDIRELKRLMPFRGLSFVETVKGLGCSVELQKTTDLEPEQLSFMYFAPPVSVTRG